MKDKIGQVIRKTYSYWWVDGMAEIGMGLFFGILAGYNYLIESLPLSKIPGILMAVAEPLVFVACWFGYGRLVKWVKEHITYHRTGYVAYQPKNRKNRTLRAIIGGVLGFGIALIINYIGPEVLKIDSLIIIGSLMALVTLFLAIWYGINRLFVVAVAEFGLGLWVSSLALDADLQSILLMAAIGGIWLLSGLAAFVSYLMKTKPEQEDV
jgi:hypothetical protein